MPALLSLFFVYLVGMDVCIIFVQVPPTRMNLQTYKGKQVAAKKGYDLLKSKADALKVQKIVECVCLGDRSSPSTHLTCIPFVVVVVSTRFDSVTFARSSMPQKWACPISRRRLFSV